MILSDQFIDVQKIFLHGSHNADYMLAGTKKMPPRPRHRSGKLTMYDTRREKGARAGRRTRRARGRDPPGTLCAPKK